MGISVANKIHLRKLTKPFSLGGRDAIEERERDRGGWEKDMVKRREGRRERERERIKKERESGREMEKETLKL